MDEGKSVVNITPQASKQGIKAMLTAEAEKEGTGLRHFCGRILEKALKYKEEYDLPLKKPLPKKGESLNIVVPETVKDALRNWAKEKQTTLGRQCVFILEKWIEMNGVGRE